MLTEEGLIVVAGLVACGLVILGTLELIAPTRPRRRGRAPRADRLAAPAPRPPAARLPVAVPAGADDGPDGEPPIERLLWAQAAEVAHPVPVADAGAGGEGPPPTGRSDPADWRSREAAARQQAEDGNLVEARRLLEEALGDPACPEASRETLRDALRAVRAREVGRQTADALRRVEGGDEAEAMAALAEADAALAALPADGVSLRRRQELGRRVRQGYTALGARAVDRGRWDDALEPLLRALVHETVGLERDGETREQLARAVGGLVEARSAMVARLLEQGDRDGARAVCEALRALLQAATGRGLEHEAVAAALARTAALLDRVDAGR
jgi:hypothetical protein